MRDVREVATSGVPRHLRDGHYQGAAKLGHGDGYAYPHDDPAGWIDQEYRPPEVARNRYYEASGHGYEARIAERQARLRGDADDTTVDEPATRATPDSAAAPDVPAATGEPAETGGDRGDAAAGAGVETP
jgi:putative ATPase